MKIRTFDDFTNALDNCFAWRRKEIVAIRLLIGKSAASPNRILLRAGVPILYAHWEGAIKESSKLFLSYLNSQKITLNALKNCFVYLAITKKINDLIETNQVDKANTVIEIITNKMSSHAYLQIEGAIKTGSNLNSELFENITHTIGVDSNKYKKYYRLIDIKLLKKRNDIAHGENADISRSDFFEMTEKIMILLDLFRTDLENIVSTKSYLK